MNRSKVCAMLAAAVFAVAGCGGDAELGESAEAVSVRQDCSLVRCAQPLCAQGQHLSYQGGCCAVCVGPESRCAAVLCPMIKCAEGHQLVTPPGQCCGTCRPIPPAPECLTDDDCPQFACIRCPCPVSSCRGRRCVTQTPAETTCGAP